METTLTFEDVSKKIGSASKTVGVAFTASLFMGLIAQFTVPFYPVPVTLQTLGVFLIALSLSPQTAFLSLAFYLAECSLGLPFLSGGQIDPAWMFSTRAGYLAAFPIAALVISSLHNSFKTKTFFTTLLSVVAGQALIFLSGVCYLSTLIGFEAAVAAGLLPFIYPGVVKAFFAVSARPVIDRFR